MSEVTKFTVPAGHKPGACAETDSRYAMSSALLFRGAVGNMGYLASCNGKVLSILPTHDAGPAKPVLLPPKAVNANGKARDVEVNGEVRTTDGKKTEVFPLPEQEGRWPNLGQVFPQSVDGYTVLSLDVKHLAALVSAIAADGKVTLLIPPTDAKTGQVEKPVVAVGIGETRGIGLVMPMGYKAEEVARSKEYFAAHVREVPQESLTFGK
jgi:hypothetical protein